jgi:hypothetical protein
MLMDLNEGESAMALLQHCNIFHMSGGDAWKIAQEWQCHPRHLQVLKDRVERGEILYIGSSGGSIVAGMNMKHCDDDRSGLGDLDTNGLLAHPIFFIVPKTLFIVSDQGYYPGNKKFIGIANGRSWHCVRYECGCPPLESMQLRQE